MGQMTPRSRRLAGIAAAGAAAAAVIAAPQAHAAASATTHRVSPDQSVQAAVNAAHRGDTVLLRPGTYHQTVKITVPGVTLRGAGADKVKLVPPAGATVAETGISVSNAAGVRIAGLTVSGFAHYGIWGTHADRMTVAGVAAVGNAQYGIAQEKSVNARFVGNTARNNGEAGILVANAVSEEGGALDTKGAQVAGNALSGNKMGVVLRRVRDITVQGNSATGNCAGVFVVGDEGVPRAGDLTVRRNVVSANTKFCAATSRLPYVQGSGIVLTGVENTVVEGNTVTDNKGAAPMSGGIVLFHSFVNVPNTGNSIHDNVLRGNGPADIADRDTAGTGNTFSGNACAVSVPTGHC
jgi:hypothetical protein